jgi:hypothetical protein
LAAPLALTEALRHSNILNLHLCLMKAWQRFATFEIGRNVLGFGSVGARVILQRLANTVVANDFYRFQVCFKNAGLKIAAPGFQRGLSPRLPDTYGSADACRFPVIGGRSVLIGL